MSKKKEKEKKKKKKERKKKEKKKDRAGIASSCDMYLPRSVAEIRECI